MNVSGIYQIQSKCKPERTYIGSSVNIYKRWIKHRSQLVRNLHGNFKLQKHVSKYGFDDLIISVVTECDKSTLLENEQLFLDLYNPYFNICKVAGNTLGFRFSPEQLLSLKNAMKGSHIGMKFTEEHKRNLGNSRLGKKHSEETRKKFSEQRKGRVPWNKGLTKDNDERIKKHANARLGKYTGSDNHFFGKHHTEETKEKVRKHYRKSND